MNITNIYWQTSTNQAILQDIGAFIQQARLQQNKTQLEVSKIAGINRSTLVQIEKGAGGTMLSLVQILRALDLLYVFETFENKSQPSPLKLAKLDQKKRQRARAKNAPTQPKSEW